MLHSLVLIFDPKGGGVVGGGDTKISFHVFFSFMVFPNFLEQTKCVEVAFFFLENNSFSFYVFFTFYAISNICNYFFTKTYISCFLIYFFFECLTRTFFIDPQWWIPFCVQCPAKAMPFQQSIMYGLQCQHDIFFYLYLHITSSLGRV